ncbi:hypothetical protein I7I50_12027 [Histoplasma capsulatum G186AR]|uniref:Uncharacterized protein n=1 Tax=Ajellomyces capsulatus TaxID=5037 RepID=A0A8H7YDW4_AJECA|nr:hypothetical protein I7I52_11689 [Histoplasma capsulatum]QSS70403.1 hypothetical protein I7I50_12027 [Histoplasma capsulatum G186AR]
MTIVCKSGDERNATESASPFLFNWIISTPLLCSKAIPAELSFRLTSNRASGLRGMNHYYSYHVSACPRHLDIWVPLSVLVSKRSIICTHSLTFPRDWTYLGSCGMFPVWRHLLRSYSGSTPSCNSTSPS